MRLEELCTLQTKMTQQGALKAKQQSSQRERGRESRMKQTFCFCGSGLTSVSHHSVEGRCCHQQQVSWLGSSPLQQLIFGRDRQQLLQGRLQRTVCFDQHHAELLQTKWETRDEKCGEIDSCLRRCSPQDCDKFWQSHDF